MVDREQIHRAIDQLSPQSLEQLNKFIRLVKSVEDMPEEEAKQILDKAIREAREEGKAKQEHT